jgi:MoxR-like ATPase
MGHIMTEYAYKALFEPGAHRPFDEERASRVGDMTWGEPVSYVFEDATTVAINVALATGRPLLLRGHPGTGKTSLAASVARQLEWRYYSITVTSGTSGRDFLWSFDAVARLADAEASDGGLRSERAYVTPGPLWWAFDRASAMRRGELDPVTLSPIEDPAEGLSERAVILIDEIDKADPDVPNDLLLPLGSLRFRYDERTMVKAVKPPLVVITSNEERDLPRAFLRRCVVHTLEQPKPDRLKAIAQVHARKDFDSARYDAVVAEYNAFRAKRIEQRKPPPSVAELLDVLAACEALKISTNSGVWSKIATNLLDKATEIPPEKP